MDLNRLSWILLQMFLYFTFDFSCDVSSAFSLVDFVFLCFSSSLFWSTFLFFIFFFSLPAFLVVHSGWLIFPPPLDRLYQWISAAPYKCRLPAKQIRNKLTMFTQRNMFLQIGICNLSYLYVTKMFLILIWMFWMFYPLLMNSS